TSPASPGARGALWSASRREARPAADFLLHRRRAAAGRSAPRGGRFVPSLPLDSPSAPYSLHVLHAHRGAAGPHAHPAPHAVELLDQLFREHLPRRAVRHLPPLLQREDVAAVAGGPRQVV